MSLIMFILQGCCEGWGNINNREISNISNKYYCLLVYCLLLQYKADYLLHLPKAQSCISYLWKDTQCTLLEWKNLQASRDIIIPVDGGEMACLVSHGQQIIELIFEFWLFAVQSNKSSYSFLGWFVKLMYWV